VRGAKDLLGKASLGTTEKHYIMARSRIARRALARGADSIPATEEDRFVIHVAIVELDRIAGAGRKGDVPHERAAGELAFDMGKNAIAIPLRIQDGAHADIGDDLLRRDRDLGHGRIGAVTLARDVLGVISRERKSVVWASEKRPTGRVDLIKSLYLSNPLAPPTKP
jgi:hypothetical protein